MKIGDITMQNVVHYIKLDEGDYEVTELQAIMDAASAFIISYTGLTKEEMNMLDDLYIAYMVLCQDMWDNRTYSVDNNNVNRVVDAILGIHCKNLVI